VTNLRDVVEYAHLLWPLAGAENWDSPGLVSGSLDSPVARILFAVDAVAVTVEQAVELKADLLITHHPLLMRGITSVNEDLYKGNLIARLIRGNVALLAAHTNADVVRDGVSDIFAQKLGLVESSPIEPGLDPDTGIGRVGNLVTATTLGSLAGQLAKLLPNTAGGIKVSGDFNSPITRVALCGGAGDSLLGKDAVRGADVFITSDLRHHPAQEAREQAQVSSGPALIDVSHWAAEWLWLETAAAQIKAQFPNLDVQVSDLRTDPWDFLVVQ
jgi:dinuclear metal center YbgI/SA1388 family protein